MQFAISDRGESVNYFPVVFSGELFIIFYSIFSIIIKIILSYPGTARTMYYLSPDCCPHQYKPTQPIIKKCTNYVKVQVMF